MPKSKYPVREKMRYGPTRIASIVGDVVRPIYKEKGEILARLIAEWPAVVGELVAEATMPIALTFPRGEQIGGSLTLKVYGSYAAEISHQTPQIVERISVFFGYKVVENIRLKQG